MVSLFVVDSFIYSLNLLMSLMNDEYNIMNKLLLLLLFL
jgi:hypothetical protein